MYGVWYNSKGKEGVKYAFKQMKYFISVVKNNNLQM